jgi:hypothetical protein
MIDAQTRRANAFRKYFQKVYAFAGCSVRKASVSPCATRWASRTSGRKSVSFRQRSGV